MKRKNLFFLFCALMAAILPVRAQHYVLKGSAPEGVKTVYLTRLEIRVTDSAKVDAQGTFTFEGEADGKFFGVLEVKDVPGIKALPSRA